MPTAAPSTRNPPILLFANLMPTACDKQEKSANSFSLVDVIVEPVMPFDGDVSVLAQAVGTSFCVLRLSLPLTSKWQHSFSDLSTRSILVSSRRWVSTILWRMLLANGHWEMSFKLLPKLMWRGAHVLRRNKWWCLQCVINSNRMLQEKSWILLDNSLVSQGDEEII